MRNERSGVIIFSLNAAIRFILLWSAENPPMRPVLFHKPNLMSGYLIIIIHYPLAIRHRLLLHLLTIYRPNRLDHFQLLVRWPSFQPHVRLDQD